MTEMKVTTGKTTGTSTKDVIEGRDSGGVKSTRIGVGDIIKAGDGDDVVYGGKNTEFIKGGNGEDVLLGGGGNDELRGDGGNDVLMGGSGIDIINGGGGIDVGVFTGNYDNYEITDPIGGWKTNFLVIKDLRDGSPDGTDFVQKQYTEKLQFADGLFDIKTKTFEKGVFIEKAQEVGRKGIQFSYADLDVYSLEEIMTNKVWLGNPVYRKVVNCGTISSEGSSTKVDVDVANLDTVVEVKFIYNNTTGKQTIGSTLADSCYDKTVGSILVPSILTEAQVYAVIEYTKG